MAEIFSSLPSTAVGWVGFLFLIGMGALALYGQFNGAWNAKKKEADQLEDELVERLRERLSLSKEELEEVKKKQADRDEHDKKKDEEMAHVKGQYQTVLEILQGRDEHTQAVMQEAPAIFAIARETNELARESHKVINGLAASVVQFGSGLASLTKEVEKLAAVVERGQE